MSGCPCPFDFFDPRNSFWIKPCGVFGKVRDPPSQVDVCT
jgi:hypothetical protein